MKTSHSTLILVAILLTSVSGYTQTPQVPQKPNGTISRQESLEGKVTKVYSAKDGEFNFICYVVKWNDNDIVVTDPLCRSNYKEGDTIKFFEQKLHLEKYNPEVFAIRFILF